MPDSDNKTSLFLHSTKDESTGIDWAGISAKLTGVVDATSYEDVADFCFSLNNGRVIFGIQIQELSDSYIVALPAVLVLTDSGIRGNPLIGESVVRLFKSSLGFVCRSPSEHRYFYFKYLHSRLEDLTGLMNEDQVLVIRSLVEAESHKEKSISERVADGDDGGDDDEDGSDVEYVLYNSTTRH